MLKITTARRSSSSHCFGLLAKTSFFLYSCREDDCRLREDNDDYNFLGDFYFALDPPFDCERTIVRGRWSSSWTTTRVDGPLLSSSFGLLAERMTTEKIFWGDFFCPRPSRRGVFIRIALCIVMCITVPKAAHVTGCSTPYPGYVPRYVSQNFSTILFNFLPGCVHGL